MTKLNLNNVDPSWLDLVQDSIKHIDADYINMLEHDQSWLPGAQKVFNAFSLPQAKVRYILFGESPYPRAQSANGYAFWDAAADGLWSDQGLSKKVNRATSLRNLIKMLLLARDNLKPTDLSQQAIAAIGKQKFVQTIDELFANILANGIMPLNACLALSKMGVKKDAKAWQPFMANLLSELSTKRLDIQLILLGSIAKAINRLPRTEQFRQFQSEHPYNRSFITNEDVIAFFKPFDLLCLQASRNR